MVVDLGCGKNKRGDIGIDCFAYPGVDYTCNLGFETIPLPDNFADRVLAIDFVEHLPKVVTYKEDSAFKNHYPLVCLFNEVWRVLRPEGIFEIMTPRYDAESAHQDPTHASVWTPNTFAYFCESNIVFIMRPYGYTARFILQDVKQNESHLHALLRADKGVSQTGSARGGFAVGLEIEGASFALSGA